MVKLTSKSEMMKIENKFYSRGYSVIAGVDEAGCGPLAGPVVACAVVLPRGYFNPFIYDSKKVSPKLRSKLFDVILSVAIDIGIGLASNVEIDKFNIREATKLAMVRALLDLEVTPEVVLVDGNYFDVSLWMLGNRGRKIVVENVVKGDGKSISIASASIIAKVLRDELMGYFDKIFPGYDFLKHKGYPTKEHLSAIKRLGLTEIHRKSYKPVRGILKSLIQFGLFNEEE